MNKKIVLPVLALSSFFLASCGGGGQKYKIKFIGENYTIEGKEPGKYFKEVEKGKKIGKISNIKADEYGGYELPETIEIDAFKDKAKYTWNPVKGEIDFKELTMPDKDVTVTIKIE